MYTRATSEPLVGWSNDSLQVRPPGSRRIPVRAVDAPASAEDAAWTEAEAEAAPASDVTAADGDELRSLQEQLERARASEAQLVEEFHNYRRHAERELAERAARARVELLAELGETMLALERAGEAAVADPGAVRAGVALVARNLQKVFDAHGLQRIPTRGEAFDPTLHEAVLAEPAAGAEKGTVVREVAPGFRTAERVVRPAKVSVAL